MLRPNEVGAADEKVEREWADRRRAEGCEWMSEEQRRRVCRTLHALQAV